MIKSVFVGLNLGKKSIQNIGNVGANHFIAVSKHINKSKWSILKRTHASLAISINAFDRGGCPLDPKARNELEHRIKSALVWNPAELWLDHFRFDGRWEAVNAGESKFYVYKSAHAPCEFCKGKNRYEEIGKLAEWTKAEIPKSIPVGYYAVPFKLNEQTKLASELGQDHRLLGKIFDMTSPMLYHRMIRKPVSYISDYVKYLSRTTKKPVLPIIQTKDMPDNLIDKLTFAEFKKAFKEAKKPPSIGVSIFVWEHAYDKGKIDWIGKVFKS